MLHLICQKLTIAFNLSNKVFVKANFERSGLSAYALKFVCPPATVLRDFEIVVIKASASFGESDRKHVCVFQFEPKSHWASGKCVEVVVLLPEDREIKLVAENWLHIF